MRDRVLADLEVVMSSNPLDWPLWIIFAGLITIFVIMPVMFGFIVSQVSDYIQNEPPMGLGWCVAFTIGATLCAIVLIDLFFVAAIFDETDPAPTFLYFGYPVMTALFGIAAFSEWRKQIRIWRKPPSE